MLNDAITNLIGMSQLLSKQMETQLKIFDESLNEAIKRAPKHEANEVEKLKATASMVMNLAKEGKTEEAQSLITQMQNECKSK